MRTKGNARRGFTLVEVIVVLVVLAIVAAIAIPSMTGWIDKAKEKRLIVECRTCVDAAQTLAGDAFIMTGKRVAPSPDDIKKLAGVDGAVMGVTLFDKSVNVKSLTYERGGDSITYTADENKKVLYAYAAGADKKAPAAVNAFSSGAAAKAEIEALYNILKNSDQWLNFVGKDTQVDSTSTNGSMYAALKDAIDGLKLADAGIKTWSIDNESGVQTIVYVTDQDLSDYAVGDRVRVIRYNTKAETYTAGYMTVGERTAEKDSDTYKVLEGYKGWSEYGVNQKDKTKNLQQSADKKNADTIVGVFKDMPAAE